MKKMATLVCFALTSLLAVSAYADTTDQAVTYEGYVEINRYSYKPVEHGCIRKIHDCRTLSYAWVTMTLDNGQKLALSLNAQDDYFVKSTKLPKGMHSLVNRRVQITGMVANVRNATLQEIGVPADVLVYNDLKIVSEQTEIAGTVKEEPHYFGLVKYYVVTLADGREFYLEAGYYQDVKSLKDKTCTLSGEARDTGEFLVNAAECK